MNPEQASATNVAYAEYETTVKSPEQRAGGIAEHWEAFSSGLEQHFYAYFMLEDHDNDTVRKQFIEDISANHEIPYPNGERQAVIKSGRAILWAVTQGYENGDPFAIEYVGERVYPVE